MRLIDTWTFDLREFGEDALPEYAILSHTWEDGEVSYVDMQHLDSAREKPGFTKIARAAELAVEEELRWLWVDTCCIDKSSSAELQEAINSMWRWYSNAAVCYAFFSDLPRMPYITDEGAWRQPDKKRQLSIPSAHSMAADKFTGARWFHRGWCLQELIAPKRLFFYFLRPNGGKCKLIADRSLLVKTISEATSIPVAVLEHKVPLSSMSVAQRMSWAANRQTRRVEDQAYSLLGIFDVSMPMLYGEGKRAFIRLQEEIMRTNSDHSLFAWRPKSGLSDGSLLATSPSDFTDASRIIQWGQSLPFEMTNRGLRASLPLLSKVLGRYPTDVAILNCRYNDSLDHTIALRLSDAHGTNERHVLIPKVPGVGQPDAWSTYRERLASVHARDVELASSSDLLIARTFQPRASSVRMMLHLDSSRGERSHEYVRDVYTEHDMTSPTASVFFTTRKPVARAGVMLQYPSKRQFSLVFGFDRYPPNDEKGVLLPGIWARFHRGPQKLKDIIKLEPIHAHGRDNTCQGPRQNGCPYMSKSASVSSLPEGDFLDARIEHEHVLDEDVLIVRANITQLSELDGGQDTGEGAGNSATAFNSVGRDASPTEGTMPPPQGLQDTPDPYVPDVRHSIFAGTDRAPSSDVLTFHHVVQPFPADYQAVNQMDRHSHASVRPPKDPLTLRHMAQPYHPEIQSPYSGPTAQPLLHPGSHDPPIAQPLKTSTVTSNAPARYLNARALPFSPPVRTERVIDRFDTANGNAVLESFDTGDAFEAEIHAGTITDRGIEDWVIEEVD